MVHLFHNVSLQGSEKIMVGILRKILRVRGRNGLTKMNSIGTVVNGITFNRRSILFPPYPSSVILNTLPSLFPSCSFVKYQNTSHGKWQAWSKKAEGQNSTSDIIPGLETHVLHSEHARHFNREPEFTASHPHTAAHSYL